MQSYLGMNLGSKKVLFLLAIVVVLVFRVEGYHFEHSFRQLQLNSNIQTNLEETVQKSGKSSVLPIVSDVEQSKNVFGQQNSSPVLPQQPIPQVNSLFSSSQNIVSDFSDLPKQKPKQQDIKQYLNDPTIQWPQQNELYHIYSALNPRLVLDVATVQDGYHDLILYDWKNQHNQMYYLKKVRENFYHIINAESKEYMKKSQKIIPTSNVSKIKFSKQPGKLWELIPAKPNVNNSFYIVAETKSPRQALDLNQGYAQQFAEIIQYEFHKFSNQVWIFRKNIKSMDFDQMSVDNFQEKASELLYNVMHKPDSINEAIILEEMKQKMSHKKIQLPDWLSKPRQHSLSAWDLPFEMTQQGLKSELKANPLPQKHQNTISLSEDEDEEIQQSSEQKVTFEPPIVAVECALKNKVAYIWYGGKEMPKEYKYLLEKCKQNTILLTQVDFQQYSNQWNKLYPKYEILPEIMPVRQRVNMLKLLYLYFESGIYADFDTQINEDCFGKVHANEIIFTNRVEEKVDIPLYFPVDEIVVPEESFMMVKRKLHPQVRRMIEEEVMEHENGGGDRWRECKYRQCLIVECQRHYRDNTYKKGYV